MATRRQHSKGIRTAGARGRAPVGGTIFDDGNSFYSTDGGKWATQRLKAAIKEGRNMSAEDLRTLDTLRHEEWKYFDQVLVREQTIRLVAVADLVSAGLTAPVANAMGKTVYQYEKITDFGGADVTLDGRARTVNDKVEFTMEGLPLPITHKDFFLNLRQLAASRQSGEPLDTTQVGLAGRVVAEKAESMLVNGGRTFGGLPIYGYTTFPDRITTVNFDGGKSWDDTTKLGSSFVKDVTNALAALGSTTNLMFGPYMVYVPNDADDNLENDYNAGTANAQTIRQRLLQTRKIIDIKALDTLASGNVLFVQMSRDNVVWVQGEPLQTIQWDEGGGFTINFKAFQIAVPLIRSTASGQTGILHMT